MAKTTSSERAEFLGRKLKQYRKDPIAFFNEVTNFYPDEWQAKAAIDVANYPKVSIRSGQGVGKTCFEANVAIWFLTCFPNSRVVATAPTAQQLNDILWSEADKWISRSALLKELLIWTKTHIYVSGHGKRWFAVAKTASKPENMQGFHEDDMLFIIDEASGVADEVIEPVYGTLTGINNKLLMCGNPTRTSGAFYDSHNRDRALFKCHKVNSLYSTRTSKENIETLIKKYGENSNVVKVRVYGDFPDQEDDVFIPLALIEKSMFTEISTENIWKISIGVDVARYGDDETVIVANVNGIVENPIIRHGQSLMNTVGDIVLTYKRLLEQHPQYKGTVTVNIDDTGLGGGVTDRLEEVKTEERLRRLEIVPVNFGSKAPTNDYYSDITTYMWAAIRTGMEEGTIRIPNDEELIAQLSIRKYFVTSNGKICLESKKDMKKRNIKSPDRADALALSCFQKNKIYSAFLLGAEAIIIPSDTISKGCIAQINIGISIANSISGTSMVATAIMTNHSKVVVLAAQQFTGEVETNALGLKFAEFANSIKSKYGRLDYTYCDRNEIFLYRCIRNSVQQNNIHTEFRAAANDDVNNRIRLTTRLMSQNRLFITEDCEVLSRAFSSATWSETRTQDTRSASTDNGTLNAFEYTIEREASRFINAENGG